MLNFKINIFSIFVVIFFVDFYGLVSSELPKVPDTTVVPPKGATPSTTSKLELCIYYKAMGPDSQKWFQKLAKVYKEFSDYLTIKYFPCMFAELNGSNLDCQDQGDPKCVAAKTQSCAISIVTDPTSLFQFLDCAMQDSSKLPNFEKCATDNKISYDPIKTCAESDKGNKLCSDFSKARPNTDTIPAFSYNLIFDEGVRDETFKATDLTTVFCEQIKKSGTTKPPSCK